MHRWLAPSVLATCLAASSAAAQDDAPLGPRDADEAQLDDERARLHFEAGRSHYVDGAYDRARDELQRAWELSRRPPLLLNIAGTLERLGEHEEAARYLERYLELEPDTGDRAIVERRIANLRRLSAGREESGTSSTPRATTTETPGATTPGGPDGGLLAGGAAMLGLAGAGLVLTATFGGLALAEDDALTNGCGAAMSCREEDVAGARTYVLATDVAWISAAVAGAIGLTLLTIAIATAPSGEAASLRVTPYAGSSEGGLVLAGTFR